MRRLVTCILLAGLIVAGCGGAGDEAPDPTASRPGATEPQDPANDSGDPEGDSGGQSATAQADDSNAGESSDDPILEGDGPLPPDSIRIGDDVYERMAGASLSDCYVHDGTPPFSINGALNDDDRFRFGVYWVEDGVYEASIENDEILWVAAPFREGTELQVEWDVNSQTISGTGLFNDAFLGKWAYGSFQFTCSGG